MIRKQLSNCDNFSKYHYRFQRRVNRHKKTQSDTVGTIQAIKSKHIQHESLIDDDDDYPGILPMKEMLTASTSSGASKGLTFQIQNKIGLGNLP